MPVQETVIDATSEDTSEETETDTGTGADSTATLEPEETLEASIDDLLNAAFDEENDPDGVMQGEHKGLPGYSDVLRHMTSDGKKLVQNLRSSYTKKTQEIADLRRGLETQQAEVQRQLDLLTKGSFAEGIKTSAEAEVSGELDLFSAEGIQAHIKREAAKMMQEMMRPLQQEADLSRQRAEIDTFKAAHPDLMDEEVKQEVGKLLIANENMKLSQAYYIVKGKLGEQAIQTAAQAKMQAQKAQRAALRKTSLGTSGKRGSTPKFKNGWEAFQYHQALKNK